MEASIKPYRKFLYLLIVPLILPGNPASATSSLHISTPSSAILSPITIDVTKSVTSTGSLGEIIVEDFRSEAPGWSTTITAIHFSFIKEPRGINGTNSIAAEGHYNHQDGGEYIITIVSGGETGTSTYKVTGLESINEAPTGMDAAIGTRGIRVDFTSGSYSAGDSWAIRVSTIPVGNITITPSAVSVQSGSGTNVSAGPVHAFASTTDAALIMRADPGSGVGSYTNTPNLNLTVPAGTYSGTYSATFTETVN